MKKLLLALFAAVTGLLSTMAVRTTRYSVPQIALPSTSASLAPLPIDTAGAATRLAGAIRFPTVSMASGAPIDTAAFNGLRGYLEQNFPLVHSTLAREIAGSLSLLYTWQGSDTSLPPVVLMGHMDVVPVPEPNLKQWEHTPFSGDVADGFVWGRGTLDDKSTVLSILESIETLLKAGHKPKRTIYLTFGHDEEVGGRYGARLMVDHLVTKGVKPVLVLDEGGFMGSGLMPGLEQRTAIVGIAEKGYVSLKLTSRASGGHSSMPGPRTAIGALSRALAALEANPFPYKLEGPTLGMVESIAPYLPYVQRMMIANLWMTRPLVSQSLAANPLGAALQHTTTSPTMLSGGIKDNVLPPEATAVVNFRIISGETIASVRERVTRVIADTLIDVALLDSVGVDPSPVSSTSSPAYQLIASTIRSMVPGEVPPVIPYLVMGGTDAKFWGPHSDKVFRFLPIPLGDGDRDRVHGVNERVAVRDYLSAVGFFVQLIRGTDTM